ncbi:hypothetical protein M422DRAFT_247958 [Sphaerobolus stellatus SS14]|nr:hypothetical protein M422DRAFT_247958 [Sphaerobolus stellatus SS14]
MLQVSSIFEHFTTRDLYAALGVAAAYAVLHQLFLRPMWFSPLRKVPGPPFGNLFYGQFLNILKREPDVYQMEWAKKYGPTVRAVGPFGFEHLILAKPSALQKILVSEWLDYPKPDFFRWVLGFATGYGLLSAKGHAHKLMRRALSPAFSLSNLMTKTEMYYPPLEGFVQILDQLITSEPTPEKGTEVLVYNWMSKITMDIICAAAFGYYPDSVHDDKGELIHAYQKLFDLQSGVNFAIFSAAVTFLPGFHHFLRTKFAYKYRKYLFPGFLSKLREFQTIIECVHCAMYVAKVMLAEKLRETDVKASEAKKDIMSLLIKARLNDTEDGYKMTDQDLLEQALTFLGPGHASTAAGSSWTLWLLATHPEYQERLRAEVLPVIAANSRPDYNTLKDLKLLDSIVMESLRILPPVPMTLRKAGKDDWVDGYFIPKGTLLYISIRVANTYPGTWGPDADEFRPERWFNLPPTYDPKFSFLDFSAGNYSCLARPMAIMELKVIIAYVSFVYTGIYALNLWWRFEIDRVIIAHFAFEPAYEGQIAKPIGARTMKPEDNMPLRVKAVGKLPIPL